MDLKSRKNWKKTKKRFLPEFWSIPRSRTTWWGRAVQPWNGVECRRTFEKVLTCLFQNSQRLPLLLSVLGSWALFLFLWCFANSWFFSNPTWFRNEASETISREASGSQSHRPAPPPPILRVPFSHSPVCNPHRFSSKLSKFAPQAIKLSPTSELGKQLVTQILECFSRELRHMQKRHTRTTALL